MSDYTKHTQKGTSLRDFLNKQTRFTSDFVSYKLSLAIRSLRKHSSLSYSQIAKELELASPSAVKMLEYRGGKQ